MVIPAAHRNLRNLERAGHLGDGVSGLEHGVFKSVWHGGILLSVWNWMVSLCRVMAENKVSVW